MHERCIMPVKDCDFCEEACNARDHVFRPTYFVGTCNKGLDCRGCDHYDPQGENSVCRHMKIVDSHVDSDEKIRDKECPDCWAEMKEEVYGRALYRVCKDCGTMERVRDLRDGESEKIRRGRFEKLLNGKR